VERGHFRRRECTPHHTTPHHTTPHHTTPHHTTPHHTTPHHTTRTIAHLAAFSHSVPSLYLSPSCFVFLPLQYSVQSSSLNGLPDCRSAAVASLPSVLPSFQNEEGKMKCIMNAGKFLQWLREAQAEEEAEEEEEEEEEEDSD
jgi:hypothetical protein